LIKYKIVYKTENVYTDIVKEAIFDILVLPTNTDYQELISWNTYNSLKEPIFIYKNLFGYDVIRIRSSKPFSRFEFKLEAEVNVKKINPFDFKPLPLEEELKILKSDEFRIDNYIYLKKTKYTYISDKNKHKILKYDGKRHIFDFLLELNEYLYKKITYCTLSTNVDTIADQVFEIERGVCQDYAHAFISIARENGIPARYVSGYLNQGKNFTGDIFMHAWVEALIPGVGWKGFDPTNNLLVDENYIKVSDGVDYSDCSPFKGVLKTNGETHTTYSVKVIQEVEQ
jgi:transglutaminase-like putative cysteine protease